MPPQIPGFLDTFGLNLLAAALGGAAAGLLGVFVIGMRIPFLAVFTAHAAMAGAIIGGATGYPTTLAGFLGALLGALLLGWLSERKLDPNAALGTLFPLTLGIAFLAIGLSPGPRSAALSLLWGSILFVSPAQIWTLAAVCGVLLLFVLAVDKHIRLLLFSRDLAAVTGTGAATFAALLLLGSAVIAVNLQLVGGLLLFALISNPAVTALRTARTYVTTLAVSAATGCFSAVGGFLAAYWLDLPVGACIVLFSSVIVACALLSQGAATTIHPRQAESRQSTPTPPRGPQ
jgi:manganese/iron transport system permease protein